MTIQLEESKFLLKCMSTKPATMLGDDTIKEMAAMLVWSLERLQEVEWAGSDGYECPFCEGNRAGLKHATDCIGFSAPGVLRGPPK